jgi:hypothetical protein
LEDFVPRCDQIAASFNNPEQENPDVRGFPLPTEPGGVIPSLIERFNSGKVEGLLALSAAALLSDPALGTFAGRVSDTGEGRWTINAAIDEACRSLFLARRSAIASARSATPNFRTSCSPRCASHSGDMSSSVREAHDGVD